MSTAAESITLRELADRILDVVQANLLDPTSDDSPAVLRFRDRARELCKLRATAGGDDAPILLQQREAKAEVIESLIAEFLGVDP